MHMCARMHRNARASLRRVRARHAVPPTRGLARQNRPSEHPCRCGSEHSVRSAGPACRPARTAAQQASVPPRTRDRPAANKRACERASEPAHLNTALGSCAPPTPHTETHAQAAPQHTPRPWLPEHAACSSRARRCATTRSIDPGEKDHTGATRCSNDHQPGVGCPALPRAQVDALTQRNGARKGLSRLLQTMHPLTHSRSGETNVANAPAPAFRGAANDIEAISAATSSCISGARHLHSLAVVAHGLCGFQIFVSA